MKNNSPEKEQKVVVALAFLFIFIAIGLKISKIENNISYALEIETINTKNIATVRIKEKEEVKEEKNILMNLLNLKQIEKKEIGTFEEVELPKKEEKENTEKIKKKSNQEEKNNIVEQPAPQKTPQAPPQPAIVWRLPTEYGIITQNPSYGHVAYDITSPRGSNEAIYPVADGTISGIYKDPAGALIVVVLHNAGGKWYSSQYVHLSRYAPGIHVGMKVDTNTILGNMGTTGHSTGVHLHITLLDCALFAASDPNCKDLNHFFNYAKVRFVQGFIGLGSVINMPAVWYAR
ncbi:MAG: M23 family metallopeptidase [Bacilli bacterium]|nr:M23 family metallopeptidase [Bacilli bacterium]